MDNTNDKHEEVKFNKKAFEFLSDRAKAEKVSDKFADIVLTLDTPRSFVCGICACIDCWCLKYADSPKHIGGLIAKLSSDKVNPLNQLFGLVSSLSEEDRAALMSILSDDEDLINSISGEDLTTLMSILSDDESDDEEEEE